MLIFGGEMLLAEHLIKMHMERGQKEKEGRKVATSKDRRKALLGLQEMEESLFWYVDLTPERLGAASACELPSTVKIVGAKQTQENQFLDLL